MIHLPWISTDRDEETDEICRAPSEIGEFVIVELEDEKYRWVLRDGKVISQGEKKEGWNEAMDAAEEYFWANSEE